jgi:hypothetical protein
MVVYIKSLFLEQRPAESIYTNFSLAIASFMRSMLDRPGDVDVRCSGLCFSTSF